MGLRAVEVIAHALIAEQKGRQLLHFLERGAELFIRLLEHGLGRPRQGVLNLLPLEEVKPHQEDEQDRVQAREQHHKNARGDVAAHAQRPA